MGAPKEPVRLTQEEVVDLNRRLSEMRHTVNNQLSLIVSAAELLRFKPDMRDRLTATLSEQPKKITTEIARFSAEFERVLGIDRTQT